MRQLFTALLLIIGGSCAHAWGDKGHEVVALIAWNYLTPALRSEFETVLQRDNSGLTATDFVSEANWVDAYRDSDRDGSKTRYEHTRRWHYVNLDIAHPDYARACFDSKPLQPQQHAMDGPAKACVIDKIEQFARELKAANTTPTERLRSLQFLIHLVGDLHQPLHAGSNNDGGGNEVHVITKGLEVTSLHGYWDYTTVNQLGRDSKAIARQLIAQTSQSQLESWRRGTPRDWALETFTVARDTTYAKLPPVDAEGIYVLDESYATAAKIATAQQLTKAGVRLAWLLEQSTPPH